MHKVKGQKVLICPEHSKSKMAGTTTYRVLRIFPALYMYSLLQSVMVKTGKNLFDGLAIWRVLLSRFEVLFQAAAVTLIRARNWVAGKLQLDPPYAPVRQKKELKQQSVKALMLQSPASVGNAAGKSAGSIGSKAGASKASGKAPMSALPLNPAAALSLKPPATTTGGKGTGKGKQNTKAAGKGKKRNAPGTDTGGKGSPGKTGKSAKSTKLSAQSDTAQRALELVEKGFTPSQITAMLGN